MTTKKKITNISIGELELSTRSATCLYNAGIKTVADLVEKSPFDLKLLPNFGIRSLAEVEFALKSLGLKLGCDYQIIRKKFPRKVVQIAGTVYSVMALANDGTLWVWQHGQEPWREVPGLPDKVQELRSPFDEIPSDAEAGDIEKD